MRGGSTGWGLGLFASFLLVACADEGPTTAPTPRISDARPRGPFASGTVLRIVSGDTGLPVAGAQVGVGSTRLESDATGEVTLPSDFGSGTFADVDHPDFLLRQTRLLEATGVQFTLFPKRSSTGLTEDFIRDVLFQDSSTGESRHIMRITPGTAFAYVVPSTQIFGDLRAMRAVNDAVAEINEITEGEIRFEVRDEAPANATAFDLIIDPNDPVLVNGAIGVARRRFSGWNIIGGTAVVDSMETARTSATHHELGHMLGLGHSNSIADVMYPYQRPRVETFSPRERLGVRLLLQRPAATMHPDNDRSVRDPRSLAAAAASVVLCYR